MKKLFSRPPFAEEVFTDKNKTLFDKAPGSHRHLIQQIIQTGNVELALKQSGMKGTVDVSQKSSSEILTTHGLSVEDLLIYLADCIKAEVLIRDKHGKLHRGIDLKIRLQAIELALKLHGELGSTKPKAKPAMDLFEDVPD